MRLNIAAAVSYIAVVAATPAPAAATQNPADEIRRADGLSLAVNPSRVCLDESRPNYLNFDLVVRNSSSRERTINELRGVVLNARGEMIERRIIWQQSRRQISPDSSVPAGGQALIFNPILFRSSRPETIRYEVEFTDQPAGSPPLTVLISPRDCRNQTPFVLPVTGRVLVYDGYDVHSHHRLTGYGGPEDEAMGLTDNFQRFALDLVVVDEQGRFFTGDGARTNHWLGWGRPVRAAGAGVVTASHDGQPDNVVIGTVDQWVDRDMSRNPMTSYGNYVLMDHGGGEFTLVGHLRQGSVRVRPGQRVVAGAVIGEIGNSGASGGVHVHFERRTGAGIAGIQTLPPYFSGLELLGDGGGSSRRSLPINSGDVVVAR